MDYGPICGLVLWRTTSFPPKLELVDPGFYLRPSFYWRKYGDSFLCVIFSYDLLLAWKSRWPDDGLTSLELVGSKVVSRINQRLYTNITVDVGPEPVTRPDVRDQITYRSFYWSRSQIVVFRRHRLPSMILGVCQSVSRSFNVQTWLNGSSSCWDAGNTSPTDSVMRRRLL